MPVGNRKDVRNALKKAGKAQKWRRWCLRVRQAKELGGRLRNLAHGSVNEVAQPLPGSLYDLTDSVVLTVVSRALRGQRNLRTYGYGDRR